MADELTASQRTIQWREAKRKAGFHLLSIWVPASVKHDMEDLAAERRQDVGTMLAAAFVDWKHTPARFKSRRLDEAAIEALIATKVAGAMQRYEAAQRHTAHAVQAGLAPAARRPAAPRADRVAVLARARTLQQQGMGYGKIAAQFQAEGLPTLSGRGTWQKGAVERLLKSAP